MRFVASDFRKNARFGRFFRRRRGRGSRSRVTCRLRALATSSQLLGGTFALGGRVVFCRAGGTFTLGGRVPKRSKHPDHSYLPWLATAVQQRLSISLLDGWLRLVTSSRALTHSRLLIRASRHRIRRTNYLENSLLLVHCGSISSCVRFPFDREQK